MDKSTLLDRLETLRSHSCAIDRAQSEAIRQNAALYDGIEALVLLLRESDIAD